MAARLAPTRLGAERPPRERVVLAVLVAVLVASLVLYVRDAYGHGDINLYHRYALTFWFGSDPLHTLPAEYPLLALAPFTLTLLPPLPDYVTVFGLWMMLLFVAGYVAVRRHESARAAEVFGVYLVLGCFGTILGRYDLVPAATVVIAYWAVRHRRLDLAYAMLALGTLLKLYPLFLVPILVIEHCRLLGADPFRMPPRPVLRGLALFAVAVGGAFAISAAIDTDDWLGAFTFNAHRPLQVESIPASLLWLTGIVGLPTTAVRSFNSYNLVGRADWIIGIVAELALVGGCVLVYWRQVTSRIDFGRALTLCVLVIICTNRVFSPQYLMWVLPLVAIVEGDYDALWLAVCALTTLVFPLAYDWTGLRGHPMPATYPFYLPALILVRNAVLLVATVRFAMRPARAEAEPEATPRAAWWSA
jgi:glycosyl transferase family 87